MDFRTLEHNRITLSSVVGLQQPWRDRAVFSYLSRPRPDNGLIYILCRAAIYTTSDGHQLHAPCRSIIYLPEGCHYQVRFIVDADTPVSTLLINFAILDEAAHRLAIGDTPALLYTDTDGSLEAIFTQIIALCYTANNLTTKSLLYGLLHRILPPEPSEAAAAPHTMSRVLAELDLHLTDAPVSIPDLARRYAMSETTFRRRFRAHTGMSPVEYINRRKIERAKQMLRSTEGTVELICETLHFYDPAYFSKQFRKYTGMTPSAYREPATSQTAKGRQD